jgi:hypothetical protein
LGWNFNVCGNKKGANLSNNRGQENFRNTVYDRLMLYELKFQRRLHLDVWMWSY